MRDERAVSTTFGYTLTLAIASILVTGLLITGTTFVDDRREEVVEDELTVIGHQIASDLARADRLVQAADSSGSDLTVELDQRFPERLAGSTYRIALEPSNDRLVLRTSAVRVTVGLGQQTALGESTASGGVVRVVYVDAGGGRLEVHDG